MAGSAHHQRLARALGATLLFYWTAPERSFLWVVRPEGVTLHTLPAAAAIAKRVERHQALVLQSRDPLAETAPAAAWLFETLVRPAGLEAGSRVIVLPDGPLHQLNPETLVVPGARPRYWIEDVTLAVSPSLGLLSSEPPRQDVQPRTLLAIGDALPATDEFPALAHADEELQRVAAAFPAAASTVYSGAEADPSVYRRADPGRFDFIHFAAHATANPVLPLESAIVLTRRDEAYKLHAREIAGVPLRAEVVTLSACRGAGSRVYAGEGMVGLAWAFLGSGAGSVVGGLWNVEDASTARLMGRVYGGLAAGLDAPAALRAAKLELLRSGTAYRKPFYWAPFVAYVRTASAP